MFYFGLTEKPGHGQNFNLASNLLALLSPILLYQML